MMHSVGGTMSQNTFKNYERERGPGGSYEQDYTVGIDPASGVFFNSDYRRHEDLKEMLDSNKDNLKLEAMKRIIGMIAKGRDASALFPAVVKNVVSKNIELKKLVYSYLERYAEEEEDLALLSISTFQRALKEPNQLIRAGALRVLSGIRVAMIAPIVMIAIRDASADMSPYVRKTAAHAIPKLYSLDNDTKPELILIIEKLLADRTVLVIGSAVMAFTKVCHEREDLIHKVYRKLCALLGDVDEWGQVIIINVLTRYARTQFTDPCLNVNENAEFYDSESDESEKVPSAPALDPDHRLLLRSARPLLQSRNSAVVMAVAQMYHHIGPASDTIPAVKALVRLLRSNPEVQELVLLSIVSMTITKKGAFDQYLRSFFIRTSDSTRVKLIKLTILTNIANENNISVILRELETYISSYDDDFVAATIQAIGRCACYINAVTDTCLNGLVKLLSNKNEVVVAESVVVIKRLLQTRAANPKNIIEQMIRLLDNIDVPQARASILWLLGEHSSHSPLALNVLKKAAKTFPTEENLVKLQILNLTVKLRIADRLQDNLYQYIFNLAKYDQNYDIRDRARFLKNFIDNNKSLFFHKASDIFFAEKPAPTIRSNEDLEHFQLGSLSHALSTKAVGYEPLPDWPKVAPPSDVRNVETAPLSEKSVLTEKKERKNSDSWDSATYSSSSSNSEESESDSEESENEEASNKSKDSDDEEEEEEEEDDAHSSSESESSEESSEEESPKGKTDLDIFDGNRTAVSKVSKEKQEPKKPEKSNLDLLLDLEMDTEAFAPTLTPSLTGFLTPIDKNPVKKVGEIEVVPPAETGLVEHEVLNRINGKGLSISYRFTRNPHLFSPSMVNINLNFTNTSNDEICDIRLGQKMLSPGMSVHEFAYIACLSPNCSLPGTLGIDFNDSLHPANLEIISSLGSSNISIKPRVGESCRPVRMEEEIFIREQTKLKGMNEHVGIISVAAQDIDRVVFQTANLGKCPSNDEEVIRFAAQTLASLSLILVTFNKKKADVTITVNCEKMVIGSMLLNELKSSFSK